MRATTAVLALGAAAFARAEDVLEGASSSVQSVVESATSSLAELPTFTVSISPYSNTELYALVLTHHPSPPP